MIDYRRELNSEQLRVVMEPGGPLLVIAGAGSGKTRTLTHRVARLIETGVPPERIVLATFTNKAARTMLARVREIAAVPTERLWGGTFHHLSHRILRSNAGILGYPANFSIIDAEDARQMIASCIAASGIDVKGDRFPKADVLGDIISLSANTDTGLDAILPARYSHLQDRFEKIREVARRYEARKREVGVMDFDDLLVQARRLLREFPEVASRYAERFLHILVDEYQDTNILQADIVDLLAARHRNLMVVGDDSQSIYSFRGADFRNILHFPERYKDCRIFKLETNYRSTPEILHLANLCIVRNDRQFHKVLKAVRDRGIRPVVVPTRNVLQQADFVAQRILELHRSGLSLREIAVLYRAHYHSMEVQMELVRRGIPFEIRSGIRFFEQAHIKDVTAHLRILLNPLDEIAWKRVLGLYPRIGRATAEKAWKFLRANPGLPEALRGEKFLSCAGKGAAPGLAACSSTLQRLLAKRSEGKVSALVDAILDEGYRGLMQERFTDYLSREDDIHQLASFSDRYASLEDFLGELALLANTDEGEGEDEGDDGPDRVTLSTIHQAKGLEWTAVLMVWCAEGMLPLARALKEAEGEEEERRLFYVAATRAKDQLYLCYPACTYAREVGYAPVSPSRFIRELTLSSPDRSAPPYEEWVLFEE
ncbi:MAG: ATP-dependent DNA helicase PcrA [Syntrophaceae bacterium PtaU1.Bin231]|nr:MAG: ATP-dependent DNA helicase PcrA [Syntrophaceae bacterium PtaU1.Bin231]